MNSKYGNIREEELKNKIAQDFFACYDTTRIIGNIDFCVAVPQPEGAEFFEHESLLWAEAKRGENSDIIASFAQLVITIGKAKTHENFLPPLYLGAFDAGRIAFIPYSNVMNVFALNDFNWNVTPSDHQSREFILLRELLKKADINKKLLLYNFIDDEKPLCSFIKSNFRVGDGRIHRIQITINNFVNIYLRWLNDVKPSINMPWEAVKKKGILDADFFLADLLSEHNLTLRQKLFVLLKGNYYEFNRDIDEDGLFGCKMADFIDNQMAHQQFWNKYARPPHRKYWDAIVKRRDLLVPQDIRERKGSYFTPRQWVELSQQYLADELGEDWQDKYVVWDCAAGTGNLLAGLTNRYKIWASTIDKADVDAMMQRSENGANLLQSHIFQFDFLNDPLSKLPDKLQEIINDPEQRKHLVVYINPPYAEAASTRTKTNTGRSKAKVARDNAVFQKYGSIMGLAGNEIYALFLIRIYSELQGCVLAEFSTLKILQAPGSHKFRSVFTPYLCRMALLPADTFDNVSGKFPIGFKIWKTDTQEAFQSIDADVYNRKGYKIGKKACTAPPDKHLLMDWLRIHYDSSSNRIAYMRMSGSDMQHSGETYLTLTPYKNDIKQRKICCVTANNLQVIAVYLSVRLCIEPTWLNDRDQFLFPNDSWKEDLLFQSDCLAFTLFHGQNRISAANGGPNRWIPFSETEVDAKDSFRSHFMHQYITGNLPAEERKKTEYTMPNLFSDNTAQAQAAHSHSEGITFSPLAQNLMDAGRNLWRYYHAQPNAMPDASFYDIRQHFQGIGSNGQMNATSTDEQYNALIDQLRTARNALRQQIQQGAYRHGFLIGGFQPIAGLREDDPELFPNNTDD